MPVSPSRARPELGSDHRAAARFDAALPLQLVGSEARTRNISATGVFFEADLDLPIGSCVNVDLSYVQGGRRHWLTCAAEVVRITDEDGHHGIGARLLTPFFAPGAESVIAMPASR